MDLRISLGKSIFILTLVWTFLIAGLPVTGQGDIVTSMDISGGSSAFTWPKSRNARKNNYAARRKSKAKRSVSQRRTTRRKVVSQSRTVAKQYRKRRTINKITPEDFGKVDITLARKSPQEASKIFAGAAEYYLETESDLQKAADYLEQAIELDPKNKDAKLAFSELSTTLGNAALDDTSLAVTLRHSKAISLFEQARKNDPLNALALVGLGQVYDEQDGEEKARTYYEDALKIDSSLSEVKAALSFIYYGENRIEEADVLLKDAISNGEVSPEIKYFLGLIRYRQGRDAEAETALKESIALDADNAEAHYYLATVRSRMGNETQAIQSFEEAVRLDPKFVNAWFDLGVAYYNTQRYDDAIRAFNVAIKENTNSNDELIRINGESFVNIAEAYRQVGKIDEAIAKYRVAVGLITDDPELFTSFGFVLGGKDLWKDAITNFEKAANVNPSAVGYTNLGWAYLKSANYNRDLRYFDRQKADLESARMALNQALGYNRDFLSAQLNLGSVLNDLGQHKEAIAPLKRANELQGKWLPAVYELSEAYLESGEYDSAIKYANEAIDIDKKFVLAYMILGKAQFKKGKTKDARKTQENLRKLDPKLAERLETYFIQNK